MKKAIRLALVAGGLGAFALASAPAFSQQVTLRLHTFLAPVANPVKHFMTPWSEKIEKDSGGRLKVQIYPAMQLGGKPEQLLQQVRDGVADIIWTLPGFTPGVMPKLEAFALPFVHRNVKATVMALQEYVPKHMQKEFEPYHVLMVHTHAGGLFMTRQPISRIEDFKGMKIRAASRTSAWVLEAVGATPVLTALPELVTMLNKNTVNGTILPYEIAPSVRMQDLTDNFTTLAKPQPRVSTEVFTLLMNKEKYAGLPPDLKKVLDNNSGPNLVARVIEIWDRIEVEGEKVMHEKTKNKFVALSAAETARFRKQVQPVYDRFIKLMQENGADGKQLIADAEALEAKYDK